MINKLFLWDAICYLLTDLLFTRRELKSSQLANEFWTENEKKKVKGIHNESPVKWKNHLIQVFSSLISYLRLIITGFLCLKIYAFNQRLRWKLNGAKTPCLMLVA